MSTAEPWSRASATPFSNAAAISASVVIIVDEDVPLECPARPCSCAMRGPTVSAVVRLSMNRSPWLFR